MTTSATAPAADWSVPKFPGKTFAFAGKFNTWLRECIRECVSAEGGRVVEDAGPGVDFLIVTPTPGGGLPQVAKKLLAALQQQGAAPEVLTPDELGKRVLPTREEAVALLKGGDAEALERWNSLCRRYSPCWAGKVDLTGSDLRGAALPGVVFDHARLDDSDLRGADLTGAHFWLISRVRLDGANLSNAYVSDVYSCSFQGADLSRAGLWSLDWSGSTFQGARLCG
ncbi:MAG TPA: pentapeptide repeat-containing protein, partial [Gemmataceae bacterium]|nr:pentapeptide repeat-containing protein [Gemmataceae bacterium]